MKKYITKQLVELIVSSIIIILFVYSCGIYRPVDARKVPASAKERVKQNIEKGEGFRAKNLLKRKSIP